MAALSGRLLRLSKALATLALAAAGPAWASAPLVGGFKTLGEKPFGALVLGEGGDRDWRATIEDLKKGLGGKFPLEFAPGLADRRAMQKGLDLLQSQRVKLIVIVPLFIFSSGDVMDQNRYLLGIREKPVAALTRKSSLPERLKSKVPLVLAKALDDHPILVDILASRAQTMSRKPAEEALVLVADAPESPEHEKAWEAAAGGLAEKVRQKSGFKAARPYLLRSGRQKERELSESGLRALVKDLSRGHKVIVVPLALTSSGRRIAKTLDGLFVKHAARSILPDPRVVQWVEESAASSARLPDMRLFKGNGDRR